MRHQKLTVKLGREPSHRHALLGSLVQSLILRGRIRTTVAKAKASRPLAERMVTLGKRGTLHARRQAISRLGSASVVKKLFESVAPAFSDRKGGYTRIVRVGRRMGDGSEVAFLEWTNYVAPEPKAPKQPKKDAAEKPGAGEENKTAPEQKD